MIDNDQITALAREYAEETYPNLSDKIISRRTQEIKEAERVIRFLLRRFCLVEKNKIKGHYIKYMQQFCDTRDIAAKEYAAGCISTLDILFPEIAKEVEDEES